MFLYYLLVYFVIMDLEALFKVFKVPLKDPQRCFFLP